MIQRILAQESPDSELRLKMIWKKEVHRQKFEFWKVQGHIWKYIMYGRLKCKKIGV
jgi:hypothetical protein